MCGIAGIIGTDKIDIPIETILNRIRHRGPDGLFYWKKDRLALGHARLSIIDLSSNANQPMKDDSTGNIIVFNGEIYNYLEIKSMLAGKYTFKTDSDTEVILAAYAVYGINFLQHLQGMFALALYDVRMNKVLLARDRLGIKPLYYRQINSAFLFASEIKAIIKINSEEAVNSLKAYEFLANRQLDCDHQTLFENVFQLPPAHYVWVDMEGNSEAIQTYWTFPKIGKEKFDEQAKKSFIDIFNHTISLHLRSDVAVGSFLSGGIDSSSITCFALNNMKQDTLHTFSAVLPYYHAENVLIEDVVKMSDKITPHSFSLSGNQFFDDIPGVIYHHDEPILDGSMYGHYKLCELAQQNNIKVLLSGSGGDELFGGYGSHIYAHQAGLLSSFQFGKLFKNIQAVSSHSNHSYGNLLFKSFYNALPIGLKRTIKNKQVQLRTPHLSIHPGIPHYYFEDKNPYYSNLINNYKSWTVPPYLHYEDRNSMAFGREIRVPFYDHKLIEFILQFGDDEIINGRSKSLMRESFKNIVPEKVLQQKGKYGFPSPIDHALKNNKEGKELFYDLYQQTPLLDPKGTARLGDEFYNKKGDLTLFWRTLSYIIWYQIFFKGFKGFI